MGLFLSLCRRLEEKEAEMELVQRKLEELQSDAEDKTEKVVALQRS